MPIISRLPVLPLQVHCGAAVLRCHGSLLQLRGAAPSRSPLLDGATGGVLLFNGQLFPGSGLEVPPLANDAQLLLQALSQAAGDEVPRLLTGLRGPWALVFWQAAERTLWFGRDAIGALVGGARPGCGAA